MEWARDCLMDPKFVHSPAPAEVVSASYTPATRIEVGSPLVKWCSDRAVLLQSYFSLDMSILAMSYYLPGPCHRLSEWNAAFYRVTSWASGRPTFVCFVLPSGQHLQLCIGFALDREVELPRASISSFSIFFCFL